MLGDAQFWRERKKAFRKSDKEEYRSLRGHWDSITDNYGLLGSEEARHRFEILVEAAARGLPNPQGIELWKLWLAELIRRKINCLENPHTLQCSQEYLENPEHPLRWPGDVLPMLEGRQQTGTTMMVFEGKIVNIDRLFEASAILCELLESLAEPPSASPAEPRPAAEGGEQVRAAHRGAATTEVAPSSKAEQLQATACSPTDAEKVGAGHTGTDHVPPNRKRAPVEYVHRYHATLPPRHLPEEEAAKLGSEWSETYIHQEYPKCKYHRTEAPVTVKDAQEEGALGPGWADSPGAFDEEAAIVTTERSNPLRWVDDWQVPGLLPDHRERIKAQLLKAEAVFSRSLPDSPARHATPMQQAFSGIAEVLFKARILTRQILENEIRLLVWDSAIAGGWYRPASDERTDGFPEQLGHYWMWADHSKDWAQLFRAETAEWLAELLDVSGAARARPGVPDPALSPGRIHKADGTCGDTNTPSETKVSPVVNSPVVRRRGFEADATRHDAIANIVGGHDARWKNGSGAWRKDFTLKGICVALDQAEIDVPATWKTGKTQMLKEKQVTITGWRDAFDLGFKKLVTDQIRYSLRMAMKKTPSNLGED